MFFKWRLTLMIAVLIALTLACQWLGYANMLPALIKNAQITGVWAELFRRNPFAVYCAYAGCYFIMTSIGFPGIQYVLLAAGSLLNPLAAIIISSIMGTLGTLPAFLTGQYLFPLRVHRHFGPHIDQMRTHVNQHALLYLFALRLSALMPNIFINLIFGAAGFTRMLPYLIVSFLGLLPHVVLLVSMGHFLADGSLAPLWIRIGLLLFVLCAFPPLMKRLPLLRRRHR